MLDEKINDTRSAIRTCICSLLLHPLCFQSYLSTIYHISKLVENGKHISLPSLIPPLPPQPLYTHYNAAQPQRFTMSRKSAHHPRSAPCYTKRTLSTLSRKAANLLHPSRSQKIVTKRKGQRFSLESQASLAEFLRRWQRESDPRLGLHATCAVCEGFVVRDGAVRNCGHQRESWGSFLFEKGGVGRGGTDRAGSRASRLRFGGGGGMGSIPSVLKPGHGRIGKAALGGKAPVPSVLRPGHGRFGKATLRRKGPIPIPSILRPGHGRLGKATLRRKGPIPIPSILRPGHGRFGKAALAGKAAVSSSIPPPSRPPRPASTAAYEVPTVVRRVEPSAECNRPPLKPDTVMQQWSQWSEGWEQSVGTINADATPEFVFSADEAVDKSCCHRGGEPRVSLGFDANGAAAKSQNLVDLDCCEQPHRNPDILMQDWREWSEGWQQRVKSR